MGYELISPKTSLLPVGKVVNFKVKAPGADRMWFKICEIDLDNIMDTRQIYLYPNSENSEIYEREILIKKSRFIDLIIERPFPKGFLGNWEDSYTVIKFQFSLDKSLLNIDSSIIDWKEGEPQRQIQPME